MADLAYVGVASGTGAQAVTVSTAARAFTTGNHILVFVCWGLFGNTVTVTDTAGNTYTALSVFGTYGQWFHCLNATGHAANVVTATFAGGVSTTTDQTVRAIEVSGDVPSVSQAAEIGVTATGAPFMTSPISFGAGSMVICGVRSSTSRDLSFSEYDNATPVGTWTEVVTTGSSSTHTAYAPYASGRAGLGVVVSNASSSTTATILTLVLSLGSAPAADTKARVSQLPVEVIRTNLAVKVWASQVAVEVLRINTGTVIRTSQVVVEALRPNVGAASASARPVVMVCT